MKNNLNEDEFEDIIKELKANGELKSNIGYKIAKIAKAVAISLGSLILATNLTLTGISIYRYIATEELSASQEDIDSFLSEYNIHTSYSTHPNFSRTSVIANKPIKFNVLIDITDEEKAELQKSIDELNNIFKVINPAYSFELELNPSKLDEIDSYNVDILYMTESEIENQPTTAAFYRISRLKPTKNGNHGCASEIRFRPGFINSHCFTHEIFHHLGFGDAYLSELATDIPSIMHSNELHIRKNDIALLVAKYGDYSTEEKRNALIEYIENFESNQDWYKEIHSTASSLIEELKSIKNSPDIIYNLADEQIFAKYILKSTYFQSSEIALLSNNLITSSLLKIDTNISDNEFLCSKNIKQQTVHTFPVDGVICLTEKNQISIIYQQNNSIYEAYKYNGEWCFVKMYDLCTPAEYEQIMNEHMIADTKSNDEITAEILSQIKDAIYQENATNTLTFEEFSENVFSASDGLTIYYDKQENQIVVEKGTKKNQNYFFTDGFIILDCNIVIYKNNNGQIEGAYFLYNDKTDNYRVYKRVVFTQENLNEKEIED